jgi:hypothetical protein
MGVDSSNFANFYGISFQFMFVEIDIMENISSPTKEAAS